MRIHSMAILIVTAVGCEGSGTDTITRSNCEWSSDHDFVGDGYNIIHQRPSNCPIPITISNPWFASDENYAAVVTGPRSAEYMWTTFYNDSWNRVKTGSNYFFIDYSSGKRVDVNDTYPAASVAVGIGQRRYDYAITFASGITGTAEVDLSYVGTAIRAIIQSGAEQGQVVELSVYPEGNALVAPITYQWYKDGSAVGGPTESNTIETQLNDVGTITIRVVATDANGQTAEDRNWIQVSEPCGPNAC